MMKSYSKTLLRFSAAFGLMGAFMGAHMAGSGGYELRPIHAHILVVGWLSLFSFAIYYRVFHQKESFLAKLHVWTAIIGTVGLTLGMWFQFVNPFSFPDTVSLIIYIIGGSVLLISYILFFVLTLMNKE
ncbi:hypothetical protein HMPREF2767_05155 [Nosocomiicoccus sp. HMSC067E10]|nr:hypothetical protein HMPREF2767_05155 [Nosocomiicoccus sp. HMSC067E10]